MTLDRILIFMYLDVEGKYRIMKWESKKEPSPKARNSDLFAWLNSKNTSHKANRYDDNDKYENNTMINH
jgi:hypothetical protein